MKVPGLMWIGSLAWAGATAVIGRGEWPGSWLALGTIGFAPLAMCVLAAFAQRPRGLISAVDAELLAWSQAQPPRPPMPKGQPLEISPPALQPQALAA